MFPKVNTRDPDAVRQECRTTWIAITGSSDDAWIGESFHSLQEAFSGRHPAFEPLDAKYHDLEHTLQGTLCLARLLLGWHGAHGTPALDARSVRLGLIAILLHDTGYLKPRGDHDGTGAKFTSIHVQRSADFAGLHLRSRGFPAADIEAVQNMIRCTGLNAELDALQFRSSLDRRVGCALASADLLGQMAAPDYVAKLPILYAEFAEAAARSRAETGGLPWFHSAEDLVQKTPAFWNQHVKPRLEQEFEGVYRFLNDPWPDGPNEYVARIEEQIALIPSAHAPR